MWASVVAQSDDDLQEVAAAQPVCLRLGAVAVVESRLGLLERQVSGLNRSYDVSLGKICNGTVRNKFKKGMAMVVADNC